MPRQKLSAACKSRDLKQNKDTWIENHVRVFCICASDGILAAFILSNFLEDLINLKLNLKLGILGVNTRQEELPVVLGQWNIWRMFRVGAREGEREK